MKASCTSAPWLPVSVERVIYHSFYRLVLAPRMTDPSSFCSSSKDLIQVVCKTVPLRRTTQIRFRNTEPDWIPAAGRTARELETHWITLLDKSSGKSYGFHSSLKMTGFCLRLTTIRLSRTESVGQMLRNRRDGLPQLRTQTV